MTPSPSTTPAPALPPPATNSTASTWDRWTKLTNGQRHYFLAVIETLNTNGITTSGEVAAALGRSTTDVSKFRGALVHEHHLLYSKKEPDLEIALPGFETWVRRHTGRTRPRSSDSSNDHGHSR